jgi:hypothetical protein
MPSPDEKTGILPLEIKKLVDSRRQVKQLMADKSLSADLRMQVIRLVFGKILFNVTLCKNSDSKI